MNKVFPLISVVVPVYNPEYSVICATLSSVLDQTYKNIEIWLVDDGSDVDLSSLVETMNDERIHYQKLPHNNANVARNYGIQHSSGSYIAMLDADDLWQENHLSDCLQLLQSSTANGLYGSLIIRYLKNQGERIIQVREKKKNETMIDYLLSTGYGAQTSTLFMCAETAKDILWSPDLHRHQDYDFVVRYSKKYRWMAKLEPSVIYRIGGCRRIDFSSCIRFIQENVDDISPDIYNRYHLNMLSVAIQLDETPDIIRYYRKEASLHKKYLSYLQFLQITQPKTQWEMLKMKFAYLFYILRIRVEICEI